MSSYVIDKRTFMRVGGFCAGLADARHYDEPALYLWDYKRERIYRPEDYKPAFEWLYRLNARSVALQYNDPEPENDTESYAAEFNAYRKKAKELYHYYPDKLLEVYSDFRHFVNCLLYQVEDPECSGLVKGFVYRLSHAVGNTIDNARGFKGSWGEFEIA